MRKRSVMAFVLLFLAPGTLFSDLFDRAPDVLPGTIPEMRDPGYWISRMDDPDGIVMTIDEIGRMNERYRAWSRSDDPFAGVPDDERPTLRYAWPGIVFAPPDLGAHSPEAVADTVRKRIGYEIAFMRSKPFGGFDAVRLTDRHLDRYEREMALDRVPGRVAVTHAITVRTTRLRNVPTFFPMEMGMIDTGVSRIEQFNITVLKIGEPLQVLHRSRSGMHVFALSGYGFGWVKTEDIAFGEKEEIEDFLRSEPFVVCTGDIVPFYSDERAHHASGSFRLAARLPLVSDGPRKEIRIPWRKPDGGFAAESAWLAEDADVSVGWVPYTRRNVVTIAFKLLDTPYDWTGAWLNRQHERLYRDIFGCFGFDMPHHAGLFSYFGDDRTVLPPASGIERQYETILAHEPFVTVMSCGSHCQLLLGEFEGRPIVYQSHGYSYEDENGSLLLVKRCCVSDMRLPTYFLKNPVTFLELR